MIGDLLNTNKRREVRTRVDQVMYMGRKYRRDKRTGYMVCTSGKRKRLHVAMWEQAAGREVPAGCVVHHLDWDKTHNEVGNFVCVTTWEHNLIHNAGGKVPGGKEYGYEIKRVRGLDVPPGL